MMNEMPDLLDGAHVPAAEQREEVFFDHVPDAFMPVGERGATETEQSGFGRHQFDDGKVNAFRGRFVDVDVFNPHQGANTSRMEPGQRGMSYR